MHPNLLKGIWSPHCSWKGDPKVVDRLASNPGPFQNIAEKVKKAFHLNIFNTSIYVLV